LLVPHRHDPNIAAKGQLLPKHRGSSEALRERHCDHRHGQDCCGEEGESEERGEHIERTLLCPRRESRRAICSKSTQAAFPFPVCPPVSVYVPGLF
jgi:hypothetical protein